MQAMNSMSRRDMLHGMAWSGWSSVSFEGSVDPLISD